MRRSSLLWRLTQMERSRRTVAAASGAWATLVDQTPVGTNGGWAATTDRQVYLTGAFNAGAPATGTKIRVTFKGPAAGQADVIAAYVGHAAGAGDAWDFDGNQVQIKVSNSGTFVVGTAAVVLADEVNFSFDKTKNLVVSVAFGGASAIAQVTGLGANFTRAFLLGNTAADTNAVGYSAGNSGFNDFVDLVEVFG